MRAHFQSNVFRKMVRSYALILTLSMLVVFSVWMAQYQAEAKREERRMYDAAVNGIVHAVDAKFQEINAIGERLAFSTWVKKAQSLSPIIHNDIDVLRQQEIRQEISVYQATIGIADTLSVVFPQRDIAVCSDFWSNLSSLFYRINIKNTADRDCLRRLIHESDDMRFISLPQETISSGVNGLVLLKRLDTGQEPKATLFVYITQMTLDNFINKLNAQELLSLDIMQDDTDVFQSQRRAPNPARAHMEAVVQSNLFGWKYRVSCQLSGMGAGVGAILYVPILLCSLALGFAGAYLLALLSYRPLQRLILNMSGTSHRKTIKPEMIEHTLHRWVNERMDLESEIRTYAAAARNNLMMSLLYGYFERDEVNKSFRQFNIAYSDAHCFQVILVGDLSEGTGSVVDKMSAALAVREDMRFPGNVSAEILELPDGVTAILLDYAADPSEADRVTGTVQAFIDRHLDAQYLAFGGSVHRGLIGISKSYQEAKNEMAGLAPPGLAGWLGGIRYYYPLDWEIQMIHNLKIGNWTVVSNVLAELEKENRNLAAKSQHRVISLIRETLLRIADDLGMTIEQTGNAHTWTALRDLAECICTRTQALSDPDVRRMGLTLIRYVEENYSRSSLSLQDLSDAFKLSISRISRIFKNATGVNFHKYLTIIRVEKAKEAFAGGQSGIAKVYREVGYENETTFRRAFISIEGMPPKKYLQLLAK